MPDAFPHPSSDAAALADLLARCRRQEPAAQRMLYERFAGPMLVVARRYAPTLADAEDALQDSFVKIFQRLDDFRADGAFAGWVRRIVISTSLDAWHRRKVRRVDFDLDSEQVRELPAADASVLDQLSVAEVRALIDKLPEGCRMVMLLYTIEGYTHAEIGQLLNVGESASKTQLTRARQRLTALVNAHQRERVKAPAASARAASSAQAADSAGPLFHPVTALLFR
jgi:RNA polymerase sigma-70 factor (ECF subfamily)